MQTIVKKSNFSICVGPRLFISQCMYYVATRTNIVIKIDYMFGRFVQLLPLNGVQ